MDVDISGVDSFQQSARFYKEGKTDFVEISFVGQKDSLIKKVTPDHMARFKDAWDAYCDGRELEQRKGTPLTDSGMNEQLAKSYIQRNVHTLEELAMLSDAQCQALGHGTLTYREAARRLLSQRIEKQKQDQMAAVSNAAASVGAPTSAAPADNTEVLKAIAELGQGIGTLVQLLTAQAQRGKPGRKPKVEG